MTVPAEATPAAVAPGTLTRGSLRWVGGLALTWALLLVVGFLALRTRDALGARNSVSFDRALFTTANIGSAAGFVVDFAKADDFALGVRILFVLQTLAGIALSLVGGGMLLARLLGRTYSDRRLILTGFGLMSLALLAGCFTVRPGEPIGVAAFRGMCALGNTGLNFGESPRPGLAFSLALVPMSLLGSLGVVVINDLLAHFRGHNSPDGHAGRVVTLVALVYMVGTCAIAKLSMNDGFDSSQLPAADALFWSAHHWGLAGEGIARTYWPLNLTYVVAAVIAIGVGTAGTATAFGLAWLFTMPPRLRTIVSNGLMIQLFLAVSLHTTLAWMEPTLQPTRRLLIVLSAVMNLGVSHQPISITGVGLCALSLAILAAKVLPLVVFAAALRSKDTA
ncbi:MAG TPA: hypothetical protein VF595_14240 [Tepidisphaeraceae bacterium]